MDIYAIRELVWQGKRIFTKHGREEMQAAGLCEAEVEEAIFTGEIVGTESGPMGTTYLVEGITSLTKRIARVSCAISSQNDEEFLVFVTVYGRRRRRG